MPTVGVLAIQGDFAKHIRAVERLDAQALEVRTAEDIGRIDGLIIPGGESTTIGKLLERFGMLDPLIEFAAEGKPVFGTCAGAILLAKEIDGSSQIRLGIMNISVKRNAYGRQIESFEADIPFPSLGEIPVRGVFIRAPVITGTANGTEILSMYGGNPVFVQEGNLLACTFHPELTEDLRIHKYFLSLVKKRSE